MKKILRASLVVWLLVACNDNSNLAMVQALPVSANDKITLGEALNMRPVCDKTFWTETVKTSSGSDVWVDYECVLSATQTQPLFSSQWAAWVERYQRRLAASETQKTEVLAKKAQVSPALLHKAQQVFEQLQTSSDLARYKALVKGSPVHNQPLETVNRFFASDEGNTYLAMTQGIEVPAARASLDAVTQAITVSGLATQSQDIDVCMTPALLVLAVVLTPQEVEKGFDECRMSLTSRYETDLVSADDQRASAQTRLKMLSKPPMWVEMRELITWTVPAKGTPTMTAHTVELSVRGSEGARRITKTLGLADNDMADVVSGDFNSLYQNALVSAMSDLTR